APPAWAPPPLHLSMLPPPQPPTLDPLRNQPYSPPIRHPVLNKFHHPFMIQRIEETPNVGIEHPVHFPLHDPNTERVQRLMRTPLGSKPVGEVHKFLLVNGAQHFGGSPLDDFIFQHQHTQRSKFSPLARLVDVRPTYRLRSVRSALDALRKILEFSLQPLLVLLPPRPVDARNRLSLQSIIGGSQALHLINMVQQCREPLSLLPPRCLTYPLKRAGHVLPALPPLHLTLRHLPL